LQRARSLLLPTSGRQYRAEAVYFWMGDTPTVQDMNIYLFISTYPYLRLPVPPWVLALVTAADSHRGHVRLAGCLMTEVPDVSSVWDTLGITRPSLMLRAFTDPSWGLRLAEEH